MKHSSSSVEERDFLNEVNLHSLKINHVINSLHRLNVLSILLKNVQQAAKLLKCYKPCPSTKISIIQANKRTGFQILKIKPMPDDEITEIMNKEDINSNPVRGPRQTSGSNKLADNTVIAWT